MATENDVIQVGGQSRNRSLSRSRIPLYQLCERALRLATTRCKKATASWQVSYQVLIGAGRSVMLLASDAILLATCCRSSLNNPAGHCIPLDKGTSFQPPAAVRKPHFSLSSLLVPHTSPLLAAREYHFNVRVQEPIACYAYAVVVKGPAYHAPACLPARSLVCRRRHLLRIRLGIWPAACGSRDSGMASRGIIRLGNHALWNRGESRGVGAWSLTGQRGRGTHRRDRESSSKPKKSGVGKGGRSVEGGQGLQAGAMPTILDVQHHGLYKWVDHLLVNKRCPSVLGTGVRIVGRRLCLIRVFRPLSSQYPAISIENNNPGDKPPKFLTVSLRNLRATVAERLVCSPPTKAIRVHPARINLDFRMWESCRTMPLVSGFSRGSPASPGPFIPALLHTHLNHPHRPNLFTHSALRRDASRRAPANQSLDASVEDFARATNIGFDARRQRRGIRRMAARSVSPAAGDCTSLCCEDVRNTRRWRPALDATLYCENRFIKKSLSLPAYISTGALSVNEASKVGNDGEKNCEGTHADVAGLGGSLEENNWFTRNDNQTHDRHITAALRVFRALRSRFPGVAIFVQCITSSSIAYFVVNDLYFVTRHCVERCPWARGTRISRYGRAGEASIEDGAICAASYINTAWLSPVELLPRREFGSRSTNTVLRPAPRPPHSRLVHSGGVLDVLTLCDWLPRELTSRVVGPAVIFATRDGVGLLKLGAIFSLKSGTSKAYIPSQNYTPGGE
ncbi:hypothetical protein PR048_021274 [Dryococelus australis]|uniref:Uncharacterized protein n=1 Tax=Dryococelus australis TaxID=614101 RepID=A0ABQ9GXQ9_9NEOP|nr:hypothetical protein PR048_021274 [Dryococelus australis]